jgi:hypothetical protein
MIKKVKDGYRVVAESGRSMGTYATKEEAERRLRQVECFKREEATEERLAPHRQPAGRDRCWRGRQSLSQSTKG